MNFFSTASSTFQRRDSTPDCLRPVWSGSFSRGQGEEPGRGRAFTLVELMVAMSVLSLMILFLFAVFNQATQAWQASEKKVDAFREARAALYVMRRDVSGLYLQTNLSMNFDVAGTAFPVGAQMMSTNSLFFVSAQSTDAQGGISAGELCTVGYYVAWSTNEFKPAISSTNDLGVNRSYNLFRYFRDGNESYANMSTYWANLAGSTNLASNMKDLFPGVSSASLTGDEVLARNVVGFSIVPYFRVGSSAPQATNGILTNRVAFLDVTLKVINYATASQLGNNPVNWGTNASSDALKDLVKKNQQDFYNRIPLSR